MAQIKYLIFIFSLICNAIVISQELPPIKNFAPTDYNAENQNWAISQSSEKLIYVANNKGLLEFNGAEWTLYPSPNETIMRSVKVVGERIYTGCYMEFGYWQKNDLGVLLYTSLSQKINVKLIEDEEFWHIINIDDWVVFQSLNRIYIYSLKDASVNTIDSDNRITKMFKVDKSIYFQIINKGIFKVGNGKDTLVFDDDVVRNNEVVNIFKREKDLLILTRDKGFYKTQQGSLSKWNISIDNLLSGISTYNSIQLKDKSFVLGTISHGLIYLDETGGLVYQINQDNGLSNNTVLSVFEDIENTIWLGLDNGISYVNTNAPFKVFHDNEGILGSVYASAIFNNNLYLGTNQGLFYRSFGSNDGFKIINGTQGQVWSLKEIDSILFCGHNSGTFIIENNRPKKISDVEGTWDIDKLNKRSDLLLQGNYDGLYLLKKNNNTWVLKNKIKGFNNSSRYFEVLGNEIFVNHEYKGLFKIDVDSTYSEAKNVSIDTLIKGSNSGIIKYNGDILYSYKKGIFKYDQTNKKFTKDSLLSKTYIKDEYVSGKMILDEINNALWIFTNSNISFIAPSELTNTPTINNIPLKIEKRESIIGYESVVKLNDGNYLFGTSSGYIRLDIDEFNIKDFNVSLDKIVNGSNKKGKTIKVLLNKNLESNFKNNENNFEISFYVPQFNKYLSPQYQFQLLGIYDDWSDWSETSKTVFENLPYGDYTFNVRARIGDKISSNIASYIFSIEKPWYISNLMIAFYALAVILFLIFMHNVYKRYYHKEQQKIKDKNKKELQLAKAQNEKEIMKIRNEQLHKDVQNKSRELAASTMSIVKKNELLAKIKDQLTKADSENNIEPVLKIIDRSLDHNDNWKLFKEAFNNVDRKFLKKLKELHPNLSPNDLKLCAYLRLNLSSKEIAPLFNISARSVEIKRYRLRKKLNLSHEDNLVSYILEL